MQPCCRSCRGRLLAACRTPILRRFGRTSLRFPASPLRVRSRCRKELRSCRASSTRPALTLKGREAVFWLEDRGVRLKPFAATTRISLHPKHDRPDRDTSVTPVENVRRDILLATCVLAALSCLARSLWQEWRWARDHRDCTQAKLVDAAAPRNMSGRRCDFQPMKAFAYLRISGCG
jgi:hypothetical protein